MTRWISSVLAFGPPLLALCGFAASGVSAQEAKRGGTLTYAVLGDPPTIDCHAATSFATMHYVAPHYSLLIKLDPNDTSKVIPDVAETWSESADKLTYTFKIRPGITFHDGSALTSADVKATFERLRQPPAGVVSVRQSVFSRIASVETPDPLTAMGSLVSWFGTTPDCWLPLAAFLSRMGLCRSRFRLCVRGWNIGN